jgi:DNA polymerase V
VIVKNTIDYMPRSKNKEKLIEIISAETSTELALPLVETGISAGFPSPALDFANSTIDLNKYLIKNPSSTFYGRVRGNSLKDAGIDDNDILIIDRSLEPQDGKIAVCFIDGEFTAKRIKIKKNEIWLMPENKDYQPIRVTPENEFIIWGIVTYVIKKV